jgi:hypothetical protein
VLEYYSVLLLLGCWQLFFLPWLFGSIFFIAFFGRFATRGFKNAIKKIARKSPQLLKKALTHSLTYVIFFLFRGLPCAVLEYYSVLLLLGCWQLQLQLEGRKQIAPPPRALAASQTHPPADFVFPQVHFMGVSR